jgi:hypothetical protein
MQGEWKKWDYWCICIMVILYFASAAFTLHIIISQNQEYKALTTKFNAGDVQIQTAEALYYDIQPIITHYTVRKNYANGWPSHHVVTLDELHKIHQRKI